jgi:hypothetical protein
LSRHKNNTNGGSELTAMSFQGVVLPACRRNSDRPTDALKTGAASSGYADSVIQLKAGLGRHVHAASTGHRADLARLADRTNHCRLAARGSDTAIHGAERLLHTSILGQQYF